MSNEITVNQRQQEIASWFDKTYERRAEQYLRPVEAYEVFLKLLNPTRGQKILDVACGIGRILQASQEYDLDAYGVDISENAVKLAKQKLNSDNIFQGNAEALPFDDDTFDYITCIGSLERFINLDKALTEQYRVSKKEAKICYLVRNSQNLRWLITKKGLGMLNKKGHQGAKSYKEWADKFSQHGFEIVEVIRDQWPIKKMKKIASLGLGDIDYKSLEKGIIPLEYVGEFIFLLKKV